MFLSPINVSVSLSLKSINISSGEDLKKKEEENVKINEANGCRKPSSVPSTD